MAFRGNNLDFPFLRKKVLALGLNDYGLLASDRVMDPWRDIKRAHPGLPNYKLGTICASLGVSIRAHDALSDSIALKNVMDILF